MKLTIGMLTFYVSFAIFFYVMELECKKGKGWAWTATVISLPFVGIPLGMLKAGEIEATWGNMLAMLAGIVYTIFAVSRISASRGNRNF